MSASLDSGQAGRPNSTQLFAGTKFWLALRLPTRNDFISKIRHNGGIIVPLEKNADILIADHAKANAPPNSFSWKWIDASLRAGVLLDLAEYPAGPQISVDSSRGVQDVVQTGFVGGVGKATRTKFTAEDDKVLAAWVTQKILEGHTDRGNGIYNELAAKNPRHTSQSWRDRWIKYVSKVPPSSMPSTAVPSTQAVVNPPRPAPRPAPPASLRPATVYIPPMNVPRVTATPRQKSPPQRSSFHSNVSRVPRVSIDASSSTTTPASTARPISNLSRQSAPTRHEISPQTPTNRPNAARPSHVSTEEMLPSTTPHIPETHPRKSHDEVLQAIDQEREVEFTEADRRLLLKDYDDIVAVSPTQLVTAWGAWEAEYPQHTAGQWHTYFVTQIKPAQERLIKERKKAKSLVEARLKEKNRHQVSTTSKEMTTVPPPSVLANGNEAPPLIEPIAIAPVTKADPVPAKPGHSAPKSVNSKPSMQPKSPKPAISTDLPPPRRLRPPVPYAFHALATQRTPQATQIAATISSRTNTPSSITATPSSTKPMITRPLSTQPPPEPFTPQTNTHPSISQEFPSVEKFSQQLINFLKSTSSTYQPSSINLHHTVCSKRFSLYTLFLTVNSDKFGGSAMIETTLKWAPIATQLGYNCIKSPQAPKQIRDIYMEYLATFEVNYRQFMDMKKSVAAAPRLSTAQSLGRSTTTTTSKKSDDQVNISSDDDDVRTRQRRIARNMGEAIVQGLDEDSSDDSAFVASANVSAIPSTSHKRRLVTQASTSSRKKRVVASNEPEIPESPT